MFLSRNNKNNVYPCKPQFYYIKVGFKGVKIIETCLRDEWQNKHAIRNYRLTMQLFIVKLHMFRTGVFCDLAVSDLINIQYGNCWMYKDCNSTVCAYWDLDTNAVVSRELSAALSRSFKYFSCSVRVGDHRWKAWIIILWNCSMWAAI